MPFLAQASSNAWAQKSSPFAIASLINGTASLRRRGEGELDAVVGEHGTDLVGNGCDQAQQELP
jgi:hypothetical protein